MRTGCVRNIGPKRLIDAGLLEHAIGRRPRQNGIALWIVKSPLTSRACYRAIFARRSVAFAGEFCSWRTARDFASELPLVGSHFGLTV
jgi:hypothetical protein